MQKNTGRRDDCHDSLLFPPERGEHGVPFELRKEKIVSSRLLVRIYVGPMASIGVDADLCEPVHGRGGELTGTGDDSRNVATGPDRYRGFLAVIR